MRVILLLLVILDSILSAAATEPVLDRLATGFLAQPAPGHYWAMSSSYRASFTPDGIQLIRHGRRADLKFPGARMRWRAEGETVSRFNFLGAHSQSLPGSAGLRAANAFPGVDIVIRLQDGRLKSEFQLAPGVSPAIAGYCLQGARATAGPGGKSVRIDAGAGWEWEENGLESWQTTRAGQRIAVPTRFRIDGQCVRFETAAIDPSLPLTIDPELAFSTYAGGGMFDEVTAVAADAQGNSYFGGWTESSDFPVLGGYQNAGVRPIDGFIAKVNAAGQLVFASYLGGSGEDRVAGIAVDGSGNIAITGYTTSFNFPKLSPANGALSGGRDAFVLRLAAAGNQLIFSTYLGGNGHDLGNAIAIDPSGNIAVVGQTASTNFPVLGAYSGSSAGGLDGFLARFSPAGALLSSSYFGGGGDDRIRGIAAGADGSFHITGSTGSSNFPVASAQFPSLSGSIDAFYSKFNNNLSALAVSTYLGGTDGPTGGEEAGYGITVDSLGRAWIAGDTPSRDFPGVAGGNQTTYGGGESDGFVSVFTAAGSLEWSTYIGGMGIDIATSISAGAGFVGLSGYTISSNFPVRAPLQPARAGDYDAFWAAFPTNSTVPTHISYLGGSRGEGALAAAASGGVMVIGGSSTSSNFPLQSPIQSNNPGGYGGFVSLLRFGPGPLTVSPAGGSGASGSFTFTLSHSNGNAAIVSAGFLFNSTFSVANGCQLSYNRSSNQLSLYKDAGATWLTLTPGAGGTVDNGLCSVNGAGVSVATTAASLVITIPVVFSPSFGGARNIYANATDNAGLSAAWPLVGQWTVPGGSTPVVNGIAPASGTGASQVFKLTLSDNEGFADISTASIIMNNTFNGSNACHISVARSANTVSLLRDSDGAWLPVVAGSNASVSNDYCTISGAGASIFGSGNGLTVVLPLSFKGAFAGSRNIYVNATDSVGKVSGWVTAGTWTVPGVQAAPVFTSLTPNAGSGATQSFSLAFSDANGASDIESVIVVINTSLNGGNSCYLSFSRAANTLYLFRDSDGSWQALPIGTSGSVTNNNCTVSGAGLSSTDAGNKHTLVLPLTFKTAFNGTKNFYVNSFDSSNLTTGWITAGTWNPSTVAAKPEVASLTPNAGGGASQVFTAVFTDTNGQADLGGAAFLINSALNGANGCYISFNRAANTFYLLRDSDSSWQSIVPGSNGSVSNANCTLSGTGLGASGSGNNLSIALPLTFKPAFSGLRNFYVSAFDVGNLSTGWVTAGTWNPFAPASAPTVPSLSPNAAAGPAQNFTLVIADANGYSDIAGAAIVINNSLNGANACYLSYSRGANTVSLLRDSDGAWLSIAPGASGSISNNNCTISGSTLSITGSGSNITLMLPITAKPAFAGARSVYVLASDAGGLSSGWITAGTWNPSGSNAAPSIVSLSPSSGSGTTQTFTAVLSDPNGFADIATGYFVVNSTLNANNACYFAFNRAINTFYLFRDSDGAWQSISPGAAGSVTNNNCTLSGSGLSLSGAGNNITVSMPISFKPAYAGAKNFYAMTSDSGSLTSGWIAAGSWTVP